MRLDRKELLQRLMCVRIGTNKRETIQQSSCVVFRRGRAYSLSQEIACSVRSGLPKDVEGAVQVERLVELLKLLKDDEIDLAVGPKALTVRAGKGRRSSFTMEDEVVLPVDEVERPSAWSRLHEDFSEAVDLAHRCTKKDRVDPSFVKECVHVCRGWMEACDAYRAVRYTVPTFVDGPALVRGESIRCIVQLGMTRGAVTPSWLHFRNGMGLRVSVRKFEVESYPDLKDILSARGRTITFPKALADAVRRAGVLHDESEGVRVEVSGGRVLVEGSSAYGSHRERLALSHDGEDIVFRAGPKLLADVVTNGDRCEVTDRALRVDGGKYVYVTSLEAG